MFGFLCEPNFSNDLKPRIIIAGLYKMMFSFVSNWQIVFQSDFSVFDLWQYSLIVLFCFWYIFQG